MKTHPLIERLKVSESASRLRIAVDVAISNTTITRDEYDAIMAIASEDGHIDRHEQAILAEFHQMINDRDIKFKI